MRSLISALGTGFLLVALAACGGSAPEPSGTDRSIPFDKEGELTILQDRDTVVTLDIEIADTDSARSRGLMERDSLPDRSGMLFIFPQEEQQSFWMANTPLSLDLLFIGADRQIVDIAKYAKPFSSENIVSDAPAQYVLEVPAGFADQHGLLEGDRVAWRRTD
jgi:hypothetical protein